MQSESTASTSGTMALATGKKARSSSTKQRSTVSVLVRIHESSLAGMRGFCDGYSDIT